MSTGTPAYMSPEQVSGQPGDARSDLYSLGGIFFEMLTGRPPYDDEGGATLMLKHLQAPVPLVSAFLDRVDPSLDAFIQKALAKNPDDRFQSAKEFSRAMRDVYTGRDPTATSQVATIRESAPTASTDTTAAARETSRSRSVTYAVLVVGVVAALAAIFAVATILRSPPTPVVPTATAPLPTIAAVVEAKLNSPLFTGTFADNDPHRADWPQDDVAGFLRTITPDGLYHLRSERPSTASTSIFNPDYQYGNISIGMDGTLESVSNPAGAFGIVFRYQDQDHYNVFAVDGMGRYSIWVRSDGEWHELRKRDEKWTRNEAINPAGGKNHLAVDVFGATITGTVNGKQVTRVVDTTFRSGGIGIYLATHTSGVTDALIDQVQVFPVSPPSMTGG